MTVLLSLGTFVIAAVVTARVTRALAVSSPVRRINYRGLSVPTAAGIAVVIGVFTATAFVVLLAIVFDESQRLRDAQAEVFLFAIAAAGFALLGLWDDLAGRTGERGWRAHLTALLHGHATAGAMKLLGGVAFAIVIADRGSFGWTIVSALVIALSANAFNLFDVRPGRAGKWFLLAMVAILFVPGPSVPPIAMAAGAAVAFMTYDLRERAMLGNTGAMALGGMAGVAFVMSGHTVEIVVLVFLTIMHIAADKPGLSKVIEAVPPLRVFDRAGRVHE